MAEGKDRQMWQHTSCLAAIVVNASGNVKKGTQITPNHFDPYYVKMRQEIDPKVTWQMMAKMYDKSDRRKKKRKKDAFPDGGGAVVSSSAPPSNVEQKGVNNE
jgi:hypothetical protein